MSFLITYRANGKLLLTGEYLVLHGAKAIAVPLKVGQRMVVSATESSGVLQWQAFYHDQLWFSCELRPEDFSVQATSHPDKSELLSLIFKTIKSLNPEFAPQAGMKFETTMEFSPEWGLGSSSTLISLLSQWGRVDPFQLNEMVFQGSGFDIACATGDGPIFYIRNQPVIPVELGYPFLDQLFLVYSGRKKGTAKAVRSFLKEKVPSNQHIAEMTALSEEIAACGDQTEFNRLLQIHEATIGRLIGQIPVKEEYFPDFEGSIKSLGAWGGDFWLVSTELSFSEMKNYFENKGFATVFKWGDLILKR